MTVLRCSQKLLKRLRQPAKPPEPAPHDNPLGEWCADIQRKQDAWHQLAYSHLPAGAIAAELWHTPGKAHGYAFPAEVLRALWLPSAQVITLPTPV